ncbi:MAG TPA: TM0106 family RecB-like putative nuclease, partial [Acidimicrobiales bacterium]|nr:TM0106 family RecB-like putative nuclease [Acidimicrobiales bacterium]
MADRLLTPSKITAWLDCAHFLTLRHQVDDGTLVSSGSAFGELAQLLVDKGLEHESACRAHYKQQGKSIFDVPGREPRESFAAWVRRIGNPLDDGYDVIYQMPLVHDGVRGVADFLVKVVDPDTGAAHYEPLDAKLARAEAKPGHVLQLCFYADALHALTGQRPRQVHLWLGSGRVESLAADDFAAYWNRMRHQLAALLAADSNGTVATSPEPCGHCAFCEFAELCTAVWRADDSLIYVAGLRQQDRPPLVEAGVSTLAMLAAHAGVIDGLRPERLVRLVGQAALQVEGRARPEDTPPFRLIEPTDDPTWGRGFDLMPEPDDGDVFLDFEGHPFWRPDAGLFFLFGLIALDTKGQWRYKDFWAHDQAEEAVATQSLIDYLVSRRAKHPAMHVYHYNHTERSALERLAADHGVGEVALAELIDTGLFIDLLAVARNALQVGVESYGLKHLERLTEFERGHEIDAGAGAVVEYEGFTKTRDPAALDRIAAYNEDDVRATLALRDWLVEHRPASVAWRIARLEPDDALPELDAQVTELHAFGPDTPEHLLGDLLGYWRREWKACVGPKLAMCDGDTATLFDAPDALAGLTPMGPVERFGKKGQALKSAMRFRFGPQVTDAFRDQGDSVLYPTAEGPIGYATIDQLDVDAGVVDLIRKEGFEDPNVIPSVVVLNDWVSPNPKPAALGELATRLLDQTTGDANPVSLALLRRDLPAFEVGHGPSDGCFRDDLDEMTEWVCHLDQSYVAIQGPPGTGKTYRGARLIRSLTLAGRRVGITAFSHHAIDNLLAAVIDAFDKEGGADELRAVRKVTRAVTDGAPGVTFATDNKVAAKPEFNLVAGTTWLFANDAMQASPVDVLIIDEAGQLALADALAASRSARSLVLLGDPLQLAQVSQAAHPGGGGLSVLEHVLGDDVTMPSERGVFLAETRRMHPDICSFISEQIYEGRLSSHTTCGIQATEAGTGLRWLRAEHTGRSTESPEEAALVANEIGRLLAMRWTDSNGSEAQLAASDIMVVAPYNDQVNLIRSRLDLH